MILRRTARLVVIFAALWIAACETLPSRDAARVGELNRRHASRYHFSTRENLYLLARAQPGVTVDSAEIERIFSEFFLPEGKPVQTTLVYLNVYDAGGRFLYQLAYDPARRGSVRGRTEAY